MREEEHCSHHSSSTVLARMDSISNPFDNPSNLVSGDLANKTTSIWSETISGKRKLNKEDEEMYEQKKAEYIKALVNSKTKEEKEEQQSRIVCSRCGKTGHMSFQCFNFLSKDHDNTGLNELVSSSSESEKDGTRNRSRSRETHHRHHQYCHFELFSS